MRISKKIISIAAISFACSSAGAGVGATTVLYTQSNKINLKQLIRNNNLGFIYQKEKEDEQLLRELIQNNLYLAIDYDKLDLIVNEQDNKVIIKPKIGDSSYNGQIEMSYKLSQDLEQLIINTNLGKINKSDKTKKRIIELIKEINPDINDEIDFSKLDFKINQDNVIVKAKDKMYSGQVELTFKTPSQKEIDIDNIKNVWNTYFNGYFRSDSLPSKRTILKTLIKKLDNNIRMNIDWSKSKDVFPKENETLNFIYKDSIIELNVGKFNQAKTKHKYKDNSNTQVTEIGYYLSEKGLFKIDRFNNRTDSVPKKLPEIISDLSFAFVKNKNMTIQGLESWDTYNVTTMYSMFEDAISFNQEIGNWDTSNVTDMGWMFSGAENFNEDINAWDVSNVKNMRYMFSISRNFNQPLDNWNTSNVTDMRGMFEAAGSFNSKIFNAVESVTDMSRMFTHAYNFNQPIGNWNTSQVTNMKGMFEEASNFNQNIYNWNVSLLVNWEDFLLNSGHEKTSWDNLKELLPKKIFKNTQTESWERTRPSKYK
ncbi:BspA family leucine-rich repeat surface protein [Mycoplasma yeatsii]|uniref:Surface protein n=1 Tax=Mycoplasma yeatsii TaxID=51365 RepID=A0ABU0NFA5_9MOLU|nr:BspA family leucine-rich repeat surface protein [Mycoplasma yeatsii]MDQ0568054.1 surface protein [Mycoplasma yeatsii]